MNNYENIRQITGNKNLPDMAGYFSLENKCRRIYSGEPDWRTVKKAGLYRGGNRIMNMLGTAKILCDRFAVCTFTEEPEIICDNEKYGSFIKDVINKSNLFGRMNEILSYAFAMGGCTFRPYIYNSKIMIDCVYGDGFIPLGWDSSGITDGCFCSTSFKNGKYYTLYEMHGSDEGVPFTEHRLFGSKESGVLGTECELSELYPELDERVKYEGISRSPLFSCFKIAGANNIYPEIPLGISAFANAADTLKALDIAFDSFTREFILGRKRIIVPSSCVQTVVDIATGEQRQYFDADDEAYVALKCDEERDLKITDNTVELRVDEHIKAINALLNILCFQTGLSVGTFSFDAYEGVKTATEIISRDNRTAATVKANQNNLSKALISLFKAVAALGVYSGVLEEENFEISLAWHDGIITDENTMIDNNIRLVNSGLKSKISAIMEVCKCSLEDAEKEYERILAEEK